METEAQEPVQKVLSAEEQDMADGHRYPSQEFRDARSAGKPAFDRKKGKDGQPDSKNTDGKKGSTKKPALKDAKGGERIAKVLARAGLASRREVERLIGLGKIAVNGRILETPAVLVASSDVITVEGKVIGKAEPTRLWRYHKPVGLMTTHSDPQGRPTVFEKLPQPLPRVISVGRLDLNSEGLLLLTNDGELARALEMPSTAWVRRYRARALGHTTQADLDRLQHGTTVDGVIYGPMEATLDKKVDKADGRANVWLTVAITEGKNREVRKVLESIGLKVNRLIRLAYGPFQLGNLETGEVEEVGPRVIRELLSDKIDPRNLPPEGASQTRDAPKAREGATEGRRGGGDRFRKADERSEGRGSAGKPAFAARGGKPSFKDGGGKPSFKDRDGKAAFGERPARASGDKPRFSKAFEEKRVYKERDFDQRPRFEGDGESKDRRPQREFRPRSEAPRGGADKKPWTPRPERSERDGEKKAWTPRPEGRERAEGERKPARKPYKPGGERSSFKPRADRDGIPAGEAGAYERAKREFGGGERKTSFSDRPKRDFGPRSDGDRPAFKKPYARREEGGREDTPRKPYRPDRPQGERAGGERVFSRGPKREFTPREDGDRKPYGDKPRGERPAGGGYKSAGPRPGGKPGFKPGGGKPSGSKPGFGKPRRDRD